MRFLTTCVNCDSGDAVRDMVDAATDISRRTFLKSVSRDELWLAEQGLGYDRNKRQGLTMANDWHVSYHKSTFQGVPCVYFVHSAIEWIFT